MNKKLNFLKYIAILLLTINLFSCNKTTNQNVQKHCIDTIRKTVYIPTQPDSNAVLVADSIIYSVYIKNPDTTDKWTEYCLRNMNRKKLLDLIFNNIYNGKLTAYSYRDWVYNEKVIISPDSIKNWEKLIGKQRIGKIEFVERWFYDPKSNTFIKQVLEITLGYELYNDNGQVKGYAPVFKISFNPYDNKQLAK